MAYKEILKIVPTLQAASLASYNLKEATKKNKKPKDMLKLGVTNIVGVSLIKTEFDLMDSL